MGTSERVATWLELAIAPQRQSHKRTVRVHSVGGKSGSCFAVSMDGRWVCAGNGEITVFKGIGAVLHFFQVLGVETFEPGTCSEESLPCDVGQYCLKCDRLKGLLPCHRCRTPGRGAREQALSH